MFNLWTETRVIQNRYVVAGCDVKYSESGRPASGLTWPSITTRNRRRIDDKWSNHPENDWLKKWFRTLVGVLAERSRRVDSELNLH
jgi:hypothetical protein